MALGYSQNFVSAQYLVNDLTEFDQILYMLHVNPYPKMCFMWGRGWGRQVRWAEKL